MLYVGTCGYAYREWIGSLYPATIRQGEMLAHYAGCFPAVEIDSSFYGVPRPQTVARMNAQTSRDFRFAFKLPRNVTHPLTGEYAEPHAEILELLDVLRPLRDAGKVAALLAQFPPAFLPGAASWRYLERVAELAQGWPVVVEFRERRWQAPQTFAALRDLALGWCCIDAPALPELPRAAVLATGQIGYARFHGRNAATWRTGDNVTRYAYEYARSDLKGWLDGLLELAGGTRETYVFFNNHAEAGAVRGGRMLLELLRAKLGDELSRTVAAVSSEQPQQASLF